MGLLYVLILRKRYTMTTSATWGMVMITLLFAWTISFAMLTVLNKSDSTGAKYFAYTTFGVAPLMTIVGLWLLNRGRDDTRLGDLG
jgi:hypothetical protein